MNSLFPYVGGKCRWLKGWISQFPPHNRYVSVFGGSGTDILFKPPSTHEVFNDLDADITNLFRVLRSDRDELIRLVTHTPARSRQTYCDAVDLLRSTNTPSIERAWAFLVTSHQSLRTKHPRLHGYSGYSAMMTRVRSISCWLRLSETIQQVANRLKNVRLESMDFREVLKKYDGPDTFFFVDPPYHPDTRNCDLYQHEMSRSDHSDLLRLLNSVKGKVWLCGYDCNLYKTELCHWRKQTHQSRTPHANWTERTEVVWRNFVPVVF